MLNFKKDYNSKIIVLFLSMFCLRVPMEGYEDRGDVLMKPTGIFETEEGRREEIESEIIKGLSMITATKINEAVRCFTRAIELSLDKEGKKETMSKIAYELARIRFSGQIHKSTAHICVGIVMILADNGYSYIETEFDRICEQLEDFLAVGSKLDNLEKLLARFREVKNREIIERDDGILVTTRLGLKLGYERGFHTLDAQRIAFLVKGYRGSIQEIFGNDNDIIVHCKNLDKDPDEEGEDLSMPLESLGLAIERGDKIEILVQKKGELPEYVLELSLRYVKRALEYEDFVGSAEYFRTRLDKRINQFGQRLPCRKIRVTN